MSKKFHERLLKGTGVHARPFHSEFASLYMKKLGWQEGQGLGREKNGRVDCLQIRRREEKVGLGHENASETKAQDQWKNWWDDLYNSMAAKLKTARTRKSSTSSASSEEEKEAEVSAARSERRSYALVRQQRKSAITVKGFDGNESSTLVSNEETSLTMPRAAFGVGFALAGVSSAAQDSSSNSGEGAPTRRIINEKSSEKTSSNYFCKSSNTEPASAEGFVESKRTEKKPSRGFRSRDRGTSHDGSDATESNNRRNKSIFSGADISAAAAVDCCSSRTAAATTAECFEKTSSLRFGNIDTRDSSADTLYGFVRGKAILRDVADAEDVSTAADTPTSHFNAKGTDNNSETLQSSAAVAAAAALSPTVSKKAAAVGDETGTAEKVTELHRRRKDKKRKRKCMDEEQRASTAVELPSELEALLSQQDDATSSSRATAMCSSEDLEKAEARNDTSIIAEKQKKKEKVRSKKRMVGVMTELSFDSYEKKSVEESEAVRTTEGDREGGVEEDAVCFQESKEKKRRKKRKNKLELRKTNEERDEDHSKEISAATNHNITGVCVAEQATLTVRKESTKRGKKQKREKEARELK